MAHHESHSHDLHIVPPSIFLKVLITLLVLTAVTVGVALIDFGTGNIVVAMVVASVKAFLVIYFFMHGAYENKIVITYVILPFILLAIMLGGTLMDDTTRDHHLEQFKAAEPNIPKY